MTPLTLPTTVAATDVEIARLQAIIDNPTPAFADPSTLRLMEAHGSGMDAVADTVRDSADEVMTILEAHRAELASGSITESAASPVPPQPSAWIESVKALGLRPELYGTRTVDAVAETVPDRIQESAAESSPAVPVTEWEKTVAELGLRPHLYRTAMRTRGDAA